MIGAVEILLRGTGQGCVYALLALGFVIIYQSSRVVSFAQPGLMLSGAIFVSYFVAWLDEQSGPRDPVGPLGHTAAFYVAVPLGVLATALLGLVIERLAVRPMLGKPPFAVAIMTLGVDIAVRIVGVALLFNIDRQIGDPWGLELFPTDHVPTEAGIDVQQRYVAMIATTTVIVAALFAFFRFTRMGLAMRAAAYDQEAALAQGISVDAVFALAWALAGGLAALGGTFVAGGGGTVDQNLWIGALVALPVIILGGLDSLPGAVIGGLAIGILQELVAEYQHTFPAWVGPNISVVTPYLLMFLVLLVRPYGLFGTREVERV